jgi:hypothetical protein
MAWAHTSFRLRLRLIGDDSDGEAWIRDPVGEMETPHHIICPLPDAQRSVVPSTEQEAAILCDGQRPHFSHVSFKLENLRIMARRGWEKRDE